MPRSSLTTVPPVTTAMSSSIALRRSPKPGAPSRNCAAAPRARLLRHDGGDFLSDFSTWPLRDVGGRSPELLLSLLPGLAEVRSPRTSFQLQTSMRSV